MDPLDPAKVAELLELTGGDPSWLKELLQVYLSDTRKRLGELAASVATGSADRIQRDAHGIKGASSNIGASTMARLCQEMESLARAGDVAGARAHLARLEAEYERIRAFVPRVGATP